MAITFNMDRVGLAKYLLSAWDVLQVVAYDLHTFLNFAIYKVNILSEDLTNVLDKITIDVCLCSCYALSAFSILEKKQRIRSLLGHVTSLIARAAQDTVFESHATALYPRPSISATTSKPVCLCHISLFVTFFYSFNWSVFRGNRWM